MLLQLPDTTLYSNRLTVGDCLACRVLWNFFRWYIFYKNNPHKLPSFIYDANCILLDLGVMAWALELGSSELGL